ncbi:MAG: plastocyanin/azurin family copper-binding protein [Gemmatimonadota bacterium]
MPTTISVAVGGTVTWRNGSPVDHNVTSTTGAFAASPTLPPNATFQVTFPQAGIFPYVCTIHEGMSGSVTVRTR